MPNLRQLFLQHVAQTSHSPLSLEVKRADGIYIYDSKDKQYIDIIAGIGVSCLGHCHPAVVTAIEQQLRLYLHTMVYGEYILSPQVQLATLLTEQLPESLNSVYFVNSGAEATEGAMKLAKRYTGRAEIVTCRNAYHGSTQGAASLMSDAFYTAAFRPLLPGIRHIEFNQEDDLSQITDRTAAVIMETVQAEAGIYVPRSDYLRQVRQRCNDTGALLILDEIQAGFGRTGSLFAFEQYGSIPDVLLLAKAMGGGMPIGAFIASREIMASLSFEPVLGHITTFGGHPVCCAAALATLQTLLASTLIEEVNTKAELFRSLLDHSLIVDFRSAGLWMAVELPSFEIVETAIQKCLKKGMITDWFLFNDKCLRLAPPLIIREDEIRTACHILLEALDELG